MFFIKISSFSNHINFIPKKVNDDLRKDIRSGRKLRFPRTKYFHDSGQIIKELDIYNYF